MDSTTQESPHLSAVPRVSVILPTYNRAHYLAEAIESVVRQTLTDLELIIVDDGSTDSTCELVRAIRDERVRYVAQPHRGLSVALNRGLEKARGDYIARLDSDDVFFPDALASLVAALEREPAVEVAWASGRLMDREGRDQPRTRGSSEHYPGEMLRSLLYDDCTTSPAMLTRKSCFARVGPYDEGLAFSEDWDMALRLAREFRFRYVDQIVVRIREHDDSITGRYSPRRTEFLSTRTAPLDKLFRDPQLPADIAAMKPIAYANVHIFRGHMWLSTRNFAAALREFAEAVVTSGRPLSTAAAIAWRVILLGVRSRAGKKDSRHSRLVGLRMKARVSPRNTKGK